MGAIAGLTTAISAERFTALTVRCARFTLVFYEEKGLNVVKGLSLTDKAAKQKPLAEGYHDDSRLK